MAIGSSYLQDNLCVLLSTIRAIVERILHRVGSRNVKLMTNRLAVAITFFGILQNLVMDQCGKLDDIYSKLLGWLFDTPPLVGLLG